MQHWIKGRLPVSRNIFLVHGEEDALAAQAESIRAMGVAAPQVIVPSLDQVYRLDQGDVAQLLADTAPRLSEVKAEEARKGWDWTNDYAAFTLDLKQFLQGLSDDRARQQAIRDLRRMMQKRA